MTIREIKKAFAVLLSGAALLLTLGAGCNEQEGGENDNGPGVENTEDGGEGEDDDG